MGQGWGGILTPLQVGAKSRCLPFAQLSLPGGPWHSPHAPFKRLSLLRTLSVPVSAGSGRELSCSRVVVYTKALCGDESGGSQAWDIQIEAAFDSSQTRLNRNARIEPDGAISGVVSEYYESLLCLQKKRKRHHEAPPPIPFLWAVTKAKRGCCRGVSCYDCPVFKLMIRSFSHSHFLQ